MADSIKQNPNISKLDSDDSLDCLLDSALGDFDMPLPKVTAEAAKTPTSAEKNSQSSSDPNSQEWCKEFKQIQDAMETFLKEDPNFQAELDQLTRGEASLESNENFPTSLEEAMKALADGAQSIPEPSAEELSQFFNNLGLADGVTMQNKDQFPDFMPFMQNVMQNLLSKELLYPALKDIVNRYPDWLAENRPNLDAKIFDKYSHQYDLMKEICEEFEMNQETSKEAQTKSFEKILSLMQKVQEYGNPPKDLMGEVVTDNTVDGQHSIKMLNSVQEQCAVM